MRYKKLSEDELKKHDRESRRKYRLKNYEKIAAQARKHNKELKRELLTHYGDGKPACVICGESRSDCLSIDHINNDGYKDKRTGAALYHWLKKNNYPEGYQTLCMNCQFVKKHEVLRKREKEREFSV